MTPLLRFGVLARIERGTDNRETGAVNTDGAGGFCAPARWEAVTDSAKPWHLVIVRVLSSLVLYPVLWFMQWENRRLKRRLARLEKQDRTDRS